jgi:GNAT superfamily N-acetyltransferase
VSGRVAQPDRRGRAGGATAAASGAGLEIVPLEPGRWDALAALFDRPGDPRWCWCAYWRRPGTSWASHDAAENRAALRALADAERAPGLLALRDGVAVGWVAVAPRPEYVRLERSRTIPHLPGEGVWAVTCFVVAKEVRRSGVAGSLLAAAIDFARANGARTLEAYPVDAGGARMPAALAYTGTLGMFERAGFSVAAETTSRPHPGMRRVVVRRDL